MVAINPNNRIQSEGSVPIRPVNSLAEHARLYFEQHPEVSKEDFLREAVEKEINFREQGITRDVDRLAHRECEGANVRHPISERDLRIHAQLIERLMLLHDEKLKQRDLWHKIRQLFLGNRLGRWLGFMVSANPDEHD